MKAGKTMDDSKNKNKILLSIALLASNRRDTIRKCLEILPQLQRLLPKDEELAELEKELNGTS
jgi:hypothetical protein